MKIFCSENKVSCVHFYGLIYLVDKGQIVHEICLHFSTIYIGFLDSPGVNSSSFCFLDSKALNRRPRFLGST
jgi:hypothetical protein